VKSLVCMATLFLLATAVGCGSGSTVSGIPVEKRDMIGDMIGEEPPELQLTALDKEAIQLALDFWKPTRIGDSYYLRYIRRSKDPKCPNKGRAIIQLRQVSIRFYPSQVDEAAKLNGIEWQGSVELQYEAGRFYVLERLACLTTNNPLSGVFSYDSPRAPDTKWSDWETASGAPRMSLERVNGKWKTDTNTSGIYANPPMSITSENIGRGTLESGGNDDTFEKVDPSDIPK